MVILSMVLLLTACSSPVNDFKLFLGTLRRSGYRDDIVIAVESETLLKYRQIKDILIQYKAIVYEISSGSSRVLLRSTDCPLSLFIVVSIVEISVNLS